MDLVRTTEDAPPGRELGVLRLAAWSYLATAVFGAYVSVRDDLPGEPFGWRTGRGVRRDLVTGFGSALSAPSPLLIALAWTARRCHRAVDRRTVAVLTGLAAAFLAGMACEPVTTQVAHAPSRRPARTAVVVANLTLPVVMAASGLRYLARPIADAPTLHLASRSPTGSGHVA